ncbi:carbonyl reductase [NADPH] 2, partial [Paramuricea clavata]
ISGNIKTICADLLNLDEAVKAIESTDDHIDLLVNNAAQITPQCSVLDITEDELNKTIKVNLTTPLRLSQMVARDLIKRGVSGAIVNVSSIISNRFTLEMPQYR